MRLAKAGGSIDITSEINPEPGIAGPNTPHDALKYVLGNPVPLIMYV